MFFKNLFLTLFTLTSISLREVFSTVDGNSPYPFVHTPLGKIQGSILKSRLGREIYAFRGIRYAKAPVNELRFKPPVPVEKWNGIYNATVDGPLCPQPADEPTSEDCLILNVYTTKLQSGTKDNLVTRPVIVYLHAGGYYGGGSTSVWAGPRYWMDQDVVLVTMNYRLATLGKYTDEDLRKVYVKEPVQ